MSLKIFNAIKGDIALPYSVETSLKIFNAIKGDIALPYSVETSLKIFNAIKCDIVLPECARHLVSRGLKRASEGCDFMRAIAGVLSKERPPAKMV